MSDAASNPFESDEEQYRVLVNAEEQHSLWPVFTAVPGGWTAVFGPASRTDCLDYVARNWTDITPKSRFSQESVR